MHKYLQERHIQSGGYLLTLLADGAKKNSKIQKISESDIYYNGCIAFISY